MDCEFPGKSSFEETVRTGPIPKVSYPTIFLSSVHKLTECNLGKLARLRQDYGSTLQCVEGYFHPEAIDLRDRSSRSQCLVHLGRH